MAIKKFESFVNEMYHRSRYYDDAVAKERKTKFGNWLEGLKSRIEQKSTNTDYFDRRYFSSDSRNTEIEKMPDPFKIFGRAVAKGVGLLAAAYDSLFSERVKDGKYKSISDDEWDRWEKTIDGKKIKEEDAETFYKSGALKGKEYFGKKFNPRKPSNEDEENYMDDLEKATGKYYTKIK